MDQIFKDWMPSHLTESNCGTTDPAPIEFNNVISAFGLLPFGLVCATLLLLIEFVARCIKKNSMSEFYNSQSMHDDY